MEPAHPNLLHSSKVQAQLIFKKQAHAHIQTGSIWIWVELVEIFVSDNHQPIFHFPVLEITSEFQLV